MTRRNVRDRWTVEVLRSEQVGDACRVLLLTMALEMAERGTVSVERRTLAAALNRHPQRVAERIAEAREAGLLDLVSGAHRGRPAQYVAVIPSAESVPVSGTQSRGKGTGERYALAVRIPRSADVDSERAPIRESSASVSEHLAVVQHRERRDDHDGARALGEHDESKSRGEAQNSTTPVTVAAAVLDSPPTSAPANVNPRPAMLGRALEPAPYESGPPTGQSCRWCRGEMNTSTGRCLDCRNRTYLVAVSA
ncbi:MAG: hypothetical protein ACR2JO_00675 [Mycobacteriales bacterium]